MKVLEQGFRATYSLEKISVVTPNKQFTIDGVTHPANIQIRTTNLVSSNDAEMGIVIREEILILKMICEESELRTLNSFFTEVQISNKPLVVEGALSKGGQKGLYTVLTYKTASEIMADNYKLVDLKKN